MLIFSVAILVPPAGTITHTRSCIVLVALLKLTVGPCPTEGAIAVVRVTLTGYVTMLPKTIVEVVFVPAERVIELGRVFIVKGASTVAFTWTVLDAVPVVPVTSIV